MRERTGFPHRDLVQEPVRGERARPRTAMAGAHEPLPAVELEERKSERDMTPHNKIMTEVLRFVLQRSEDGVLDAALDALVATLPPDEQDAARVLYAKRAKAAGLQTENEPERANERLADHLRRLALEEYVEPARKRGDREVFINVAEFHKRACLVQRYPAIISALRGRAFAQMAGVRFARKIDSTATNTLTLQLEILPAAGSPHAST